MRSRSENAREEKLAKARAADAAHKAMMAFFATELGCDRDKLAEKMYYTSKAKLDAIMAKYEAQKEAA